MWSWITRNFFSRFYRTRERTTVRYTFPIIAITALFVGLASVISESTSYIAIETSKESVVEGDEFYVTVRAYAHTPVNAVDITIDYPEDRMTVSGIDTGTSVITLWTEDPYARNGMVYLRGGVFKRGFLGEHEIARIRYTATETGLAQVTVDEASLVAGDGKGTMIATKKMDKNTTRIYVAADTGEIAARAGIALITDLDGNGAVDLTDVSAFMAAWFTKGKIFDFNGDGKMTFRDFSILLADSFFK